MLLRRRISQRTYFSLLGFALISTFGNPSTAQTETALERYEPSPAGAELATVADLKSGGEQDFFVAAEARLSVSRSPLVLASEGNENSEQRVVSHQLLLHGLLRVAFKERYSLDLDVPVVLSQSGSSSAGSLPIQAPNGASLSDLRIAGQVQLIDQKGFTPGVSFRASLWAPTGNDSEFTSTGRARLSPAFVGGAMGEWGVYGASVGHRFGLGKSGDGLIENELFLRAGGGPRFGPVLVTAELFSTFQRELGSDHLFRAPPHSEGLLHAKWDFGDFFARAGFAVGLTDAIGTPAYRGLFGVGYAPTWTSSSGAKPEQERTVPAPSDRSEGNLARLRRNPSARKVIDTDGDGVMDVNDSCPTVRGVAQNGGCPEDRDDDGVADVIDSCPDVKGVSHPKAELHGCPSDVDGDGVVDGKDACPKESGIETKDPQTNGCPRSVRIEGKRILILQKVVFATGSSDIAAESYGLLKEVAETLRARPEIEMVSVEGHTDNAGRIQKNLALSRKRAIAVVRWLIENGVDEDRLQAAGFGPKRPIAGNDTAEGRAKNRRVDFIIVKRRGEESKSE